MWSTTQSSLTRSKMCVRMRCVAAVAFGGGRCPPFDCIRLHQGPHVRTAVNAEADGCPLPQVFGARGAADVCDLLSKILRCASLR
jgi:hypothetical protein